MLRNTSIACALLLSLASSAWAAGSESLRGSRASMIRQNQIAKEQDFTFLRTPAQVDRFVEDGYLVAVEGNADYRLANVSFPFARPALRTFVERLGAQYREACGERLVVTSLTRPRSLQPRNAHDLSVHPAGMAVDLRVSDRAACRQWLESTLLSLESDGMLDVTRERRPPHYHVAVFPDPYMAHVGRMLTDSLEAASAEAERAAARRLQAQEALAKLAAHGSGLQAASVSPVPDAGSEAALWIPLAALLALGLALSQRIRCRRAD
jgi:hypothetical protein